MTSGRPNEVVLGRTRATHDPASVMLFEALYAFFQEYQY